MGLLPAMFTVVYKVLYVPLVTNTLYFPGTTIRSPVCVIVENASTEPEKKILADSPTFSKNVCSSYQGQE